MRATLSRHGNKLIRIMTRTVERNFPLLRHEADDIAAASVEETWRNIDRLEAKYQEARTSKVFQGSREDWLVGCMRLAVRHRALNVLKSSRSKRLQSLEYIEENPEGYKKPTAIVWPEQEEVVFKKQLLAACGMLEPDEHAVMLLTLDRASTDEMIYELGISKAELLSRRASAVRKLVERAGTRTP